MQTKSVALGSGGAMSGRFNLKTWGEGELQSCIAKCDAAASGNRPFIMIAHEAPQPLPLF